MARKDNRRLWFVSHPTDKYNEDVKQIALEKRLRIIEADFMPQYSGAPAGVIVNDTDDEPKLTIKKGYSAAATKVTAEVKAPKVEVDTSAAEAKVAQMMAEAQAKIDDMMKGAQENADAIIKQAEMTADAAKKAKK